MKNDGLMDFGNALDLMKQGVKVSRLGWNGEDGNGMFLYIVPPYSQYTPQTDAGEHLADATTNTVQCDGFIVMKNKSGNVVPWVPSYADLLAEDWLCFMFDEEVPEELKGVVM